VAALGDVWWVSAYPRLELGYAAYDAAAGPPAAPTSRSRSMRRLRDAALEDRRPPRSDLGQAAYVYGRRVTARWRRDGGWNEDVDAAALFADLHTGLAVRLRLDGPPGRSTMGDASGEDG
jgi:hypothetical protein